MLKVEIISPSEIIFSGDCAMTVVPSIAGDIGVMEDHESFIASLRKGSIQVFSAEQELLKELEIEGGFAEISNGKKITILVD